jgi:two-component system OmpR family response regulator
LAGRRRILYLEYDPQLAGRRHALLVAAGHSVGVVMSARQALNVIGSEMFDLVLLSHTIPTTEIGEVARALRARNQRVPILIAAQDGSATEAASPNEEPRQHEELLTTIASLLHRNRSL